MQTDPPPPSRFAALKLWAAGVFIAGYLGSLGLGVASHALRYGEGAHPLMYYVVWDMFCGWTPHSYRTHVLAEGESGTWYDASTGPWDDFKPYGHLPRICYDVEGTHAARIGLNVLRHSAHEPIARLVVVEECWPKKFNLPQDRWEARFHGPKDPVSYFAVRHVVSADGVLLGSRPSWFAETVRRDLHGGEKVRRLAHRSAPLFAATARAPDRASVPFPARGAGSVGD